MISFDMILNIQPLESELSLPAFVWNMLQEANTAFEKWSALGENCLTKRVHDAVVFQLC